jgi:hypothetical protein
VTGRGTRLIAALAAVALLGVALSACGGSGSGSSSSSTTAASGGGKSGEQGGRAAPEERRAGDGEGEQSGSKEGGQPDQPASTSPLHVSGGGAGQFRVKGGDNSIQDFGEESDESELEEAARVLHDFYVARAEEEWKTACARLSAAVMQQLAVLGARSKSGNQSCPATLAALTPSLSPAEQRETTVVDAGSLRVEGDRGFLVYRGAEQTVYAINMAREGGWKVGGLAPVPLS